MKKKAFLLASTGVLACTVGVTALAVGGPKQLDIFPVKADPIEHSFTFNAATGSQFENTTGGYQIVDVTTGVSDPIRTVFRPGLISSLAFGEGGRFVEAHPIAEEEAYYYLTIGINNLTHFEIDLGVANDGGGSFNKDLYEIQLRDAGLHIVKDWTSNFKLDEKGDGTAHIVWDKEQEGYDGTVVKVYVNLYFYQDSAATSLYISSLSLTWNC